MNRKVSFTYQIYVEMLWKMGKKTLYILGKGD